MVLSGSFSIFRVILYFLQSSPSQTWHLSVPSTTVYFAVWSNSRHLVDSLIYCQSVVVSIILLVFLLFWTSYRFLQKLAQQSSNSGCCLLTFLGLLYSLRGNSKNLIFLREVFWVLASDLSLESHDSICTASRATTFKSNLNFWWMFDYIEISYLPWSRFFGWTFD